MCILSLSNVSDFYEYYDKWYQDSMATLFQGGDILQLKIFRISRNGLMPRISQWKKENTRKLSKIFYAIKEHKSVNPSLISCPYSILFFIFQFLISISIVVETL